MGKRVLITGASGMIGSQVLQQCLNSHEVDVVYSLLRRSSGTTHGKLNETVVEDFQQVDTAAEYFNDIDVVYWCQGVYTGAVDKDTFRKITVDYPEAIGRVLYSTSPGLRFCLLSGAGADRSEKSRIMFARDKGAIEKRLSAMGFGAFHTFRPGYIYPVIPRKEPNLAYRLYRWLYPVTRLFGDRASVRSVDLAQVMFNVGLTGNDKEILENKDIVRLARK